MAEVVDNELLCFVFNKLSLQLTPTISLLCVNTYDEKTIDDAKVLLHTHCEKNNVLTSTKFRYVKRTGQDKKAKDMEDIMKMAHLLGKKAPCFVAADLSKLPPIRVDNIDVCHLLTKIEVLEADLKYTKDLCTEMTKKFDEHIKSCSYGRGSASVAGATNSNVTGNTEQPTVNIVPAMNPMQTSGMRDESRHAPRGPGNSSIAPQSSATSFAAIAKRSANNGAASAAGASTGTSGERKGALKRNLPKKGMLESSNLKSTEREFSVFTKYWHKDEKEEEVVKFIKEFHKMESKCDPVITRANGYKCFKVSIKCNDPTLIYDNLFWPKGIEFKRFYDRAIKKTSVGKFNYNGNLNERGYTKNLLDYGFKSSK